MDPEPSAEPWVRHDQHVQGLNVRPLGFLAVGCGVLSMLLALTFYFSPLAVPLGVLALGLGLAARTEDSTRKMGTVAVVLSLLALLIATAILLMVVAA